MPDLRRTLKTLEFDKILDLLASHALTDGARARALALLPSDDYDTVLLRQTQTADARRLLSHKGYPPISGLADTADAVARAEKGATLSPTELLSLAKLLTATRLAKDYHNEAGEGENSLTPYFAALTPQRTLETKITRAVLSEDMIADEASPALSDIRRKIRAAGNRIKDTLQKYISGAYSRYLQETLVTTRDGRYVIPVKVEYRNEIRGLVHDTSASGATVFVEPMAVVEANNELRLLEAKEEQEIARILAELSAMCGEASAALLANGHYLTELAFFFTCASLAEAMHAERPYLVPEPLISLKRARHPLLVRETAVPIDVSLGREFSTLVITGPNTGGKTVTLKTLGLFALMVQAGLQIPAAPESEVGVFREILADIGDEQSIEQSLSTFSSHMLHIVDILKTAGEGTLLLFDELGAGTDPVEGAALATAILEHVRRRGALTAATTHYAELKAYALETEGVQNASCEFDVTTLRPTYRLILGTPGKSNAFAISSRLGLDSAIIEAADGLLSGTTKRFEGVIEKLEENRLEMERDREAAARIRAEYEKKYAVAEAELQKKLAAAERESERLTAEARRILEGARATSEFVFHQLDEVKKKQKNKNFGEELAATRRALRARMQDSAEEIAENDPLNREADSRPPDRPLRVGDRVYLVGFGQEGVVVDLPDRAGNVAVRAGILSAKLPLSRLRLLDEKKTPAQKKPPEGKGNARRNVPPLREFHEELDVRGMIGADAWEKVDKFLDEAVLSGLSSVRIIHGKGTGALRAALQAELRTDPRVRSYRNGAYGEGDLGVTVVEIK